MLAFIPAGLWMFAYYKKDNLDPEPVRLIMRTFYYGMVATVPLLFVNLFVSLHPEHEPFVVIAHYVESPFFTYVLLFILVAGVEEYVKHLGLSVIDDEYPYEVNQVVDGIVYAVSAACGFAFLENMLYFFKAVGGGMMGMDFMTVFAIRAAGSTLAHTVFSGTFGYFYAKAKLSKDVVNRHQVPLYKFIRYVPQAFKLHIIRTHILLGRKSDSGHEASELVAEGFVLAFLLHFTYDMLVNAQTFGSVLTPLAIPLIYLGFYYLSKAFLSFDDTKIVKQVRFNFKKLVNLPELRKNIVSLRDLH